MYIISETPMPSKNLGRCFAGNFFLLASVPADANVNIVWARRFWIQKVALCTSASYLQSFLLLEMPILVEDGLFPRYFMLLLVDL